MGAPGSDRWVVLTCLLPAAPVAFHADRWPSLSIGELQEMALRSAVLQVEQQHCSIWLPEKTFTQADFILFTIQVKHRERTCARCVNVIHHDLSLFEGGLRGPRWSTSFSCHHGKASGMWTSIGLGGEGEGTWMWCTGVWRGKGNRARE